MGNQGRRLGPVGVGVSCGGGLARASGCVVEVLQVQCLRFLIQHDAQLRARRKKYVPFEVGERVPPSDARAGKGEELPRSEERDNTKDPMLWMSAWESMNTNLRARGTGVEAFLPKMKGVLGWLARTG